MTVFNIRAVFDINCPWCYIGHTYLSRAITARKARHPNDSVNITLTPFYLKPPPQLTNPSAPLFPVPTQSRQKLREETYGKAHADSVLQNIKRASKAAGLQLKFNGLTGTTRNGHRLVQLARKVKGIEAAEETLHRLFRLYHENEVDITLLSVLANVGVESGLGSREEVERFLLSGEEGEVVDEMAEGVRRRHAGGVPWFEIWEEGKEAARKEVSGAQTDEAWLGLFDRIAAGL